MKAERMPQFCFIAIKLINKNNLRCSGGCSSCGSGGSSGCSSKRIEVIIFPKIQHILNRSKTPEFFNSRRAGCCCSGGGGSSCCCSSHWSFTHYNHTTIIESFCATFFVVRPFSISFGATKVIPGTIR